MSLYKICDLCRKPESKNKELWIIEIKKVNPKRRTAKFSIGDFDACEACITKMRSHMAGAVKGAISYKKLCAVKI